MITSERVVTVPYLGFSATETHVAYHYVVRVYPKRFSGNTDTVAGSGLSCDGHVWRTDNNRRFQTDDTCHIKYDNTCTTRFAGFTERTGSTVVQVGHGNHFSATTAETVHSSAFRSGK